MDPQKLRRLDHRVVATTRWLGLVVSIIVAVFCLLVYKQVITPPEAYYGWACLPAGAIMLLTGLSLAFWEPYTTRKIVFYTWTYALTGIAVSSLILGFSSFIFLSWLLLMAMVGVYLRAKGAVLCYLAMIISLTLWIGLHRNLWQAGEIFILSSTSVAVGATIIVLLAIWNLADTTTRNLDISHAKQDLEHAQLISLINSMADGVIAVDENATVALYNAAALNVLDLNSSMQGASIGKFLHPLTKDDASVDIVNLVQTTKTPTTNRDLRIKYQDGSFANLYLAIAPVHLGYGKEGKQGFVLLLRDITREKSLEEERDEFISVISHELRTPIAISEGNVSNAQLIAAKDGNAEEVKKALEEAHNQIVFLGDMINDLATLSRAERGKLTMEIETINVKDFMGELADNYRQDAEKKNLKFVVEAPDDLGNLQSSKLYVREVLQNYITNAIKYTEAGTVTLSAARENDDGILFKVADTGIGISKADQARVFDKFFRSEDYRTRQHNGTGLGLYVTMKLAKLIQAKTSLESELNKGSTFSIFIPNLEQPTETPKPEPTAAASATPAVSE